MDMIPLPVIDPDTAPYWEALRQHVFKLKRCQDCGRAHYFPRVVCPHCHSDALEWFESSGAGVIYTYTVARRPAGPAFKAETPYVVVLVDLDDGPRMMARVLEPPDSVRIGQRVEMVFDDVTEAVTLPSFRIAEVIPADLKNH
ncbi:Zn-ribbon domain-containing OB-fold protein [Cupriavidus necator]|uniref:Zn-ribbon domain-containing OB-fold protein n=1 Tax=Cupriavidus necator TaxID=106590 RepID=UPI003ECE5F92